MIGRLAPSTKRALVVGSIVASIALGVPHVADNWDRLAEQGPAFIAVWVALAVVFVVTGGGLATRALGGSSEGAVGPAPRLLVLNGAAAVGMGLTVMVAAVRLLPVASWPVPIALCAVDIAHTVWSRRYLLASPRPDGGGGTTSVTKPVRNAHDVASLRLRTPSSR